MDWRKRVGWAKLPPVINNAVVGAEGSYIVPYRSIMPHVSSYLCCPSSSPYPFVLSALFSTSPLSLPLPPLTSPPQTRRINPAATAGVHRGARRGAVGRDAARGARVGPPRAPRRAGGRPHRCRHRHPQPCSRRQRQRCVHVCVRVTSGGGGLRSRAATVLAWVMATSVCPHRVWPAPHA